ncbi:bifunctional ADP-dependent NAD(P)H-hydrate dehydratase/NAD(P)H-hydrate epimerase [Corynebacterium fournieri]|uniref:bifunctional ADP-dependent NAD(P)H-hydrate dehydratase/NAD(P)H-hydrate epimerase n=1 Tax=Corynebacterium fournieri TaxID=1852390 RepID=UPI0025B4E8DE|nr:bifunctional ADP-dependent NAD(P)H-hydrate dehydratase/NAD(P)H-hydrate epimerase [Corynebacterium fournieri]WJY98554.1 Bifunctional NAD(P)H-hydrate repair enzyme Nnr [Corynebacterium fournieri]
MDDFTWTAEHIRLAEQPLLERQTEPDQLMRCAVAAVAQAARDMLAARPHDGRKVLVVAGPGGNGGDGLYAGAQLAADYTVEALLTAGHAHERAVEAFQRAGGTVLDALPDTPWDYTLAIDAITGIGGTAGLRADLSEVVALLDFPQLSVLSVDVPSGIEADTGDGAALHVTADATVTFGGWRRAHALNPACGTQLLADIAVGQDRLSQSLEQLIEDGQMGETLLLNATRAVPPAGDWTPPLEWMRPARVHSVAPQPTDDKYSGGVVGIRAGSEHYPGAALLAVAGALHATPSMVRYVGPQAAEVVRAHPEVVAKQRLEEAGRVQAWVFGPGAGTDESAARELAWVLDQQVPVLIDADGITLMANHPELLTQAATRKLPTVLTPHDGEFSRLRDAADAPASDRLTETLELSRQLRCTILRKGRCTVIATPWDTDTAYAIDAGGSWAATPGSGDVLSGLAGARMAHAAARRGDPEFLATEIDEALNHAANIHALAAALAAETPFGEAPAPASRIASFIREATAALGED